MNRQDYRVLSAVETGMQSRALVPSPVINTLANLRHGGTNKILSSLLRDNLLSHDQSCGYDGYRVTNSGYDILALWNLKCRGFVTALGDQIGVGKESDVYLGANGKGRQIVLKFHRLGRTSFRDVKKKRDYFAMNGMKKGHRGVTVTAKDRPNSWLFLSKISATKEYTFMKALHAAGYTTPEPIVQNRHVVVMGLIRGAPLYQIRPFREGGNGITEDQAQDVMEQAVAIGTQLARNGLVHCDLNEFNLMVDLSGGVQSRSHLDHNNNHQNSVAGGYGGLSISGTLRTTETEKDDIGDPYVRHSGSSASVMSRGRGALTLPHGVPITSNDNNNDNHIAVTDGTGELIAEEPQAKPHAYLENGIDPKPIVTLIDFPQMISVRHPNAEELWQRDMLCLKRFFTMKLKCDLTEERWEDIVPQWEDLILHLDEEEDLVHIGDADADDDNGDADTVNGGQSISGQSILSVTSTGSIVPKSQLRLDQELLAAGFSKEDAERNAELYYYTPNDQHDTAVPIQEEEEEGDDDEEEDQENDTKDEIEAVSKTTGPPSGLILLDQEQTIDEEYDGAITDDEDDDNNNNKHDGNTTTTPQVRVYRGRDKDNNDNTTTPQDDDVSTSAFSTMSRAQRRSQAEDIARERVRKHLDARKKSKGKKNAYRPRNSNKTFVKGKRVFQDFAA